MTEKLKNGLEGYEDKQIKYAFNCDRCGAVIGYQFTDYTSVATICECQEVDQLQKKIDKFRDSSHDFGQANEDMKFENSYFPENSKKSAYEKKFISFCDNFDKALSRGTGILMLGNAGTGKTFYSNCIRNYLEEEGNSVLYMSCSSYLNDMKSNGFEQREVQLLKMARSADLVIIDDFGTQKMSEWAYEKIFNLIDTRYRSNKPLIINSNLMGRSFTKYFKEHDGFSRILDRLMEKCVVFTFDWDSERKRDDVDEIFG